MTEHTTAGVALLHDIENVQEILGAGRSTVFKLIKDEQLRSIKVGRKRMVSDQSLRQFIAEQEIKDEQLRSIEVAEQEIKDEQLRSIKVGRKRMVSDQSLRQFIAEQEKAAQ
jgi:excisionase family DNA binding protein